MLKCRIIRVYTASYYENFFSFFGIKKDFDGRLIADWPMLATDGPIAGYNVAETGAYVFEAFKRPGEWIGDQL